MAKGKISAKQEEILEYIKAQTLQRGYPPLYVKSVCGTFEINFFRTLSS